MLQHVVMISGTTQLKIDVVQEEGHLVGLLIFEKENLDPVYQMLGANIGRPLTEVGDLEVVY